ncbi:MAG: hypothetical protein ACK5NT_02230 [Pyrinomonadaceae bacterium]
MIKQTITNLFRNKVQIGAATGLTLLLTLGLFAQLGWIPHTDKESGDRIGWFGQKIAKGSPSSNWNPFPQPEPPFVPTLSKEYIYAGDRMLAVEDYAQPTPTITPTPTPGGGGTPTPTATPTPTPTPAQETYHVSYLGVSGSYIQVSWSRSVNRPFGDKIIITLPNDTTELGRVFLETGTSGTANFRSSRLGHGNYKLRYMKSNSGTFTETASASFYY